MPPSSNRLTIRITQRPSNRFRRVFDIFSFFMAGFIAAGLAGRLFWADAAIWQRWLVVLFGGVCSLSYYWIIRQGRSHE